MYICTTLYTTSELGITCSQYQKALHSNVYVSLHVLDFAKSSFVVPYSVQFQQSSSARKNLCFIIIDDCSPLILAYSHRPGSSKLF